MLRMNFGRAGLIAAALAVFPVRVQAMLRTIVARSQSQAPAVEPEIPLGTLDALVFSASDSCDEAAPAIDALEGEIVESKARYWAYLMRQPDFILQSLPHHPGSEIANPDIKSFFDSRLNFWSHQRRIPPPPLKSIEKINDVSQRISMMAVACLKNKS